jgi:hypothetical protein
MTLLDKRAAIIGWLRRNRFDEAHDRRRRHHTLQPEAGLVEQGLWSAIPSFVAAASPVESAHSFGHQRPTCRQYAS